MNREEVRKLVGGYATGTLTEAERKLLFEAALDDQELFDELAEEDALKEIIEAPGVRSRLLTTALAPPPKPRKSWALRWIWAEGAALAAGVVVAVIMMRNPAPIQVAEVRQQVDKAAPVSDAPAPVEKGTDRAPQPAAKSEVASNAVRDVREPESDRRADDSERKKVAEPLRTEPGPPPPLPVQAAPPPVQVQPPPAAKDAAPEQAKQEQPKQEARPAPAKELTVQLEAGAVQQGQATQNQGGRSTDAVAQQSQGGPQQSTALARDQAPGTQQGGGGGKQSTNGFAGGALTGARGKAAAPAALAKVATLPAIAFRYIPMDTGVRITPALDGFLQQAGSAARAVRAGVPIDIPFLEGTKSVLVTFAIRQPGVPAQKTEAPSPTRARTGTVAFPTGTDSVTVELGAP